MDNFKLKSTPIESTTTQRIVMEKPESCNSVVEVVVYEIVRKVEETLQADRSTVDPRHTTMQLCRIVPGDFGIELRNECGLVLLDIIEGVVGASELEGLRSCPTDGSVVSLGDFTSKAEKEPSMEKCICSAIPLEDSNVVSRGSSQVGLVEGLSGTTHTIDDGARYQEKNDADDIIAMAQTKTDQNFVQTSPETVHSTMVVDIDDEDIEIDTRNVEESSHEINDEEVDEVYQTLWLSRKKELEIRAEQSARTTFLSWQRDRKSLEDIIDGSLKEYIDVYEKAHALRLQFEAEKQQLMSTVNALLSTRSSASAVSSYLPSNCQDGYGLTYPFPYCFSDDEREDRVVGAKRKLDDSSSSIAAIPTVSPQNRKKFSTPVKK